MYFCVHITRQKKRRGPAELYEPRPDPQKKTNGTKQNRPLEKNKIPPNKNAPDTYITPITPTRFRKKRKKGPAPYLARLVAVYFGGRRGGSFLGGFVIPRLLARSVGFLGGYYRGGFGFPRMLVRSVGFLGGYYRGGFGGGRLVGFLSVGSPGAL